MLAGANASAGPDAARLPLPLRLPSHAREATLTRLQNGYDYELLLQAHNQVGLQLSTTEYH